MKGLSLKRCVSLAISAAVILSGMCYAAESTVSISGIDISDDMVTVNVEYSGEAAKEITMTAIKNDSSLTGYDKYYAILQSVTETDGKIFFDFLIPERKNGISSTGEYTVCISAGSTDTASDTFQYVTKEDLESFIDAMKTANAEITGEDETALKASSFEKLLPFFTDTYENELVNLGMDYEMFSIESNAIKEDTMYFLHKGNLAEVNTTTFSSVFSKAFGISLYNNGEKTAALKIYNPTYTDKEITGMLELMENDYDSPETFEEACDTAYSLTDVNNARVDNLLGKLEGLPSTSELDTIINKIKSMNSTQQVKVCEYFVATVDTTPVKTVTQLVDLLEDGYTSVIATVSGDSVNGGVSNGGGGGGRVSTSASRVPSTYEVATEVEPVKTDNNVKVPVLEFSDVDISHWAYDCIKWLYKEGVVHGDGYGKYLPEKAVSREEFVKMIILASGISSTISELSFTDVENGAWYEEYISIAVSKGITNGISEDEFGIGENITREDMVTMVLRVLKVIGKDLDTVRDYKEFVDTENISEYAKAAVENLYSAGIINGFEDGRFAPKSQATRAEVAKIIFEMFKEVK